MGSHVDLVSRDLKKKGSSLFLLDLLPRGCGGVELVSSQLTS